MIQVAAFHRLDDVVQGIARELAPGVNTCIFPASTPCPPS